MWDSGLAGIENGVHVELEGVLPLLRIQLCDVIVLQLLCAVVHEDVDPAEFLRRDSVS